MSMTVTRSFAQLPWIRNERFDTGFILGLPALSFAVLLMIGARPELFYPILIIDLWLLGYHHVVATFTRLSFDRKSFEENRFLVLWLPLIVAAVTGLFAWLVGIWAVVTVYFYWQWFHYTRQSWGISRIYRAKDPTASYESGWLDQVIFYALPVAGILSRSAEQQPTFIGMELWSVPVPPLVAQVSLYVACGLLLLWAALRLRAYMMGRLAIVHTLYMMSHFVIFAAAYVWTSDITIGWLMINIWHNAQYILFVWMFNVKRFSKGIDPEAYWISYISQPNRLLLYMLTCVALTGILYWGVLRTIDWLFFAGISATIVLYQIVNFHHYIVDSLIWKVRKPALKTTLGISDPPAP